MPRPTIAHTAIVENLMGARLPAALPRLPSRFGVLLLAALTGGCSRRSAAQGGTAFGDAENAFMRHDFPAAEEAYTKTLETDTVVAHRDRAILTKAAIRWRIYADTP